MIVGKRIEARLRALGKSQAWLAGQVGMRQQGIASIISGASERPRKLREIARALETTQEYLLGETDDPRTILAEHEFLAEYERLSVPAKQAIRAFLAHLQESESAPTPPASRKRKVPAKRS